MELKYYICEHCGNIITKLKDSKVPVMCCGQKMNELVEHPMVEEHYIEWIDVQTSQGFQHKVLNPGDKPQACFSLCEGETVEAVYAYCNLHGLWKA